MRLSMARPETRPPSLEAEAKAPAPAKPDPGESLRVRHVSRHEAERLAMKAAAINLPEPPSLLDGEWLAVYQIEPGKRMRAPSGWCEDSPPPPEVVEGIRKRVELDLESRELPEIGPNTAHLGSIAGALQAVGLVAEVEGKSEELKEFVTSAWEADDAATKH